MFVFCITPSFMTRYMIVHSCLAKRGLRTMRRVSRSRVRSGLFTILRPSLIDLLNRLRLKSSKGLLLKDCTIVRYLHIRYLKLTDWTTSKSTKKSKTKNHLLTKLFLKLVAPRVLYFADPCSFLSAKVATLLKKSFSVSHFILHS